jgi:hypothetical protein
LEEGAHRFARSTYETWRGVHGSLKGVHKVDRTRTGLIGKK